MVAPCRIVVRADACQATWALLDIGWLALLAGQSRRSPGSKTKTARAPSRM